MKVIYSKPKGQRIKKGSNKVNTNGNKRRVNNFYGLNHWVRLDEELLYWNEKKQLWTTDIYESTCTDNFNIKNLKQAIRHIKKHNEIPKGTRMVLESNFKGYDIVIIK